MPSPISPKLTKVGIVLLNPDTGTVERVIALQYNPLHDGRDGTGLRELHWPGGV
jgi:hypothetical protein